MSSTTASAGDAAIPFTVLQDLYDRHRYLDAFALTRPLWNPQTDLQRLTIEELLLAGRLAARLGGERLSRWLHRMAYERDPSNPLTRFHALGLRFPGRHLLDDLRQFERKPDPGGDDVEIRAAWFAWHAQLWAALRDVRRADECLARARALSPDDGWVLACESSVFGIVGRWAESLASAERAWRADEGAPMAALAIATSLHNLGREEECAVRLAAAAEQSQSYHVVGLACYRQCAFAETLDGSERSAVLDTATALADRLHGLAPLADRESRKAIARLRLDIANLSDDQAGIERWAGELRLPFFRQVSANYHKNPDGRRIRLRFTRVRQTYETCTPSSLSAAMSAGGMTVSADEMAAAFTFGGTQGWAAADWLRARGFHVRFFPVTPDVAARLIEHGIAFVLNWDAEEGGHSVTVVGIDERAGTLLIHDPAIPRDTFYLFEALKQSVGPLGMIGIAVVPPERAAHLDALLPPESVVVEAAQAHERALRAQGPTAARALAADVAQRFPDHPGTRYVGALQALADGEIARALGELKELLSLFPNSPSVRVGVLSACRALHNMVLLRAVLKDVVERGMLPGLQAEQEWIRPPGRYIAEYADLLRLSSATRDEAERLLHGLLRREPASAIGWHILADLIWYKRAPEDLLLCHRLAAQLAPADEHYARSYANTLVLQKRDDEAVEWLEWRVRERGESPHAVGTWVTWASVLEDLGRPERAVAACREALERHARSHDLLTFAVPFLGRMGLWEEAEEQLQRLASVGHPGAFHEAAARYAEMRGDRDSTVEHAEAWVAELPHAEDARRYLLNALSTRDGAAAALARAAAWRREHPRHELFEEIYRDRLERAEEPRWKRYAVALRRARRNREDAAAWSEAAIDCLHVFHAASDARRARLRPRVETLIAECERAAGDGLPALVLRALWAELRRDWPAAVEGWIACIRREPSGFFPYDRAWLASSALPRAEQWRVWEQMRDALLGAPGRLTVARQVITLLVARFGLREAAAEADRWLAVRPEDPEVLEAAADMLIEQGHGRSDAQRALALLQPGVVRHPYHVGLRLSLANAYRRNGQPDEAEKELLEIVRRHPGNSAALIQLAWVGHLRRDRDACHGFLDRALSCDPQNPAVFDARAQILVQQDLRDEARGWIERSLQRFPRNVSWRERAVSLLKDCGAHEAAVAAARDGVVVAPRSAEAWLLLALTLQDVRRFAAVGEIEACFRRSLALDHSLPGAAIGLASWLAGERELYDEPLQIIADLERRMPDPSFPRGLRAWVRRRQGEAAAVSEMAEAAEMSPGNVSCWMMLAAWLEEDRNWALAKRLFADLPPQMLTNIPFQRQRLILLQHAGMAQERLDAEWDALIRDFPDDPSIPAAREHASQPLPESSEAEPSRRFQDVPWWTWGLGLWILLNVLERSCR